MNDEPIQLTREDLDNFVEKLLNGDLDMKMRQCWKCNNEFLPNYDLCECDECYFSKFPKEQVKEYYRSFFE